MGLTAASPSKAVGLVLLLLPAALASWTATAYTDVNCQGALATRDLFRVTNPGLHNDDACVPASGSFGSIYFTVSCATGIPIVTGHAQGCTDSGNEDLNQYFSDVNGCILPTHSFTPYGDGIAPQWRSISIVCHFPPPPPPTPQPPPSPKPPLPADGSGDGGNGDLRFIVVVIAVAAVCIAIVGAVVYLKTKNSHRERVTSTSTIGPQVEIATVRGSHEGYDMRMLPGLEASTAPCGTAQQNRLDPNTGAPIPKFDPLTGRQNW